MKRIRASVLFCITLAGCSSLVDLKYRGQSILLGGYTPGKVKVGPVLDLRDEDPDYLGAVRTIIGTPTKRLRFNRPASDIVRQAFIEALELRGQFSRHEDAQHCLRIEMLKLDGNQLLIKSAEVTLRVLMLGPSCGNTLWSAVFTFQKKNWVPTLLPGLASTEGLRTLAERTLSEVIDKVLDDYRFRAALTSANHSYAPKEGAKVQSKARAKEEASPPTHPATTAASARNEAEADDEYVVAGECNGVSVTGTLRGHRDSASLSGRIEADDGNELSFEGKWVGRGEVAGNDGLGRTCTLETY